MCMYIYSLIYYTYVIYLSIDLKGLGVSIVILAVKP